MTYEMPETPRKYLPQETDTSDEAKVRARAKQDWIAARKKEIKAGLAPQRH